MHSLTMCIGAGTCRPLLLKADAGWASRSGQVLFSRVVAMAEVFQVKRPDASGRSALLNRVHGGKVRELGCAWVQAARKQAPPTMHEWKC